MNSFHNLTKNNPIFSINNSKSSIKTFFDKNKDSLDVDLDYIITKKELKKDYDCDAMEEGDSDIEELDIEDFTNYIDSVKKLA